MARYRTDRYSKPTRRKHFFRGVPVVPGIAMGRVHLKFRKTQVLSDRSIEPEEAERELELLSEAVRRSKEQLLAARKKVAREIGDLEATIFDTHIAILEDRTFFSKISDTVLRDKKPVEVVVSVVVEGYYQAMSMVRDELLRERAADIRDVGMRLLDNIHALKSQDTALMRAINEEVPEGDIVFSRELLPSDITTLERRHVAGVVTEAGSGRGHCAVMLRALNIPTVMGVDGLATIVRDGDFIIVDGSTGSVLINPRKEVVKSYQEALQDYQQYRSLLTSEVDLGSCTTDGHQVHLLANISKLGDIELAEMYRMDGVGLYRTEMELMSRSTFPDEDEQYQIYRGIVEAMGDKPLTLRTMDIGPDKNFAYLKIPQEESHSLGLRSIRIAFELEEFQLTQLRAILRAAVGGKVQLMFPFITTVEDIRQAKRLLRQAQRQLDERGEDYAKDIPVGMMVEVPAAAFSLDKFVREVQFFSVGTNDLVQYVCAADRNLAEVAPWYKGYNPGVLRLLKDIVDTARAHNRPLTICGEMAGDPFYTMFLVGIGVNDLSMSAPQIPLVKKIIRSINMSGACRLMERALQYSSGGQISHLFQDTVEQILGRDLSAWTRRG